MTRLGKTVVMAFVAVIAFSYGAGVGRYGWQPAGIIQKATLMGRELMGRENVLGPALTKSPHYEARTTLFRELPGTAEIVMVGDSLTEGGSWPELVPEFRVINRGIGHDTSSGVLNRLEEVIGRRPRVVFVMVGTNDLFIRVSPETLLSNLCSILERLRGTSITPVAQSILFRGKSLQADNAAIAAVNAELAAFCAREGIRFLDLNAKLAVNGHLPDAMTYDGVHLTATAYRVWRDAVVHVAADIL